MDAERTAQALAEASASMTRTHDVPGAMSHLLVQCAAGLDVQAGAILVEANGRLELLASSSHDATELEIHQLHLEEGPCVESHRTGAVVQEHSRDAVVGRWPRFGPTMLDAGFAAVHASPLTWQGRPLGAMGLFRRTDVAFTPMEDSVARSFADIATMLVIHSEPVDADRVARRLHEALESRAVIEQAKGVLADVHRVSMAEAYARLVKDAVDRGAPLTGWAEQVISDAQRRR